MSLGSYYVVLWNPGGEDGGKDKTEPCLVHNFMQLSCQLSWEKGFISCLAQMDYILIKA